MYKYPFIEMERMKIHPNFYGNNLRHKAVSDTAFSFLFVLKCIRLVSNFKQSNSFDKFPHKLYAWGLANVVHPTASFRRFSSLFYAVKV